MKTVLVLLVGMIVWVVAYQVLSRLLFINRLKKWETMEDTMNEGAQTSLVLLLSGLTAVFITCFRLVF